MLECANYRLSLFSPWESQNPVRITEVSDYLEKLTSFIVGIALICLSSKKV